MRLTAKQAAVTELQTASDVLLARIFQVVGGNPLALKLVVGQGGVGWEAFLDELIRHSVAGTASYELYNFLYFRAWDLLSQPARKLLLAMHCFEDGTTARLLQLTAQLGAHELGLAARELSQRMLLDYNGTRYTIHRLTYTFVRTGILGLWS